MNRAGREPAEDIKRRLARACEEAGLVVNSARMYLNRQEGVRVILVAASLSDQPRSQSLLSLIAVVKTSGEWSGKVDIRCCGADGEIAARKFWDVPMLRGRSAVPMEALVDHLQETIHEWRQVVAAVKLGIPGPYPFRQARWECPSTIMGSGL